MSEYWIFPAIDPIIVSLGPIALRWYGLMYLLGFAGAMYLSNKRADDHDSAWSKEQISDLLFYGFLGVVLGGRIGYVLFYQFENFLADPLYLFDILSGGMSFHGGFLGVIVAMFWFAYKTNTRFLQVADFIAPLVPIGLFFGRIGNFINAELWGRQTDVPWAVIFPNAGGVPRHPSQLYEAILEGLVLFIILSIYRLKPRVIGSASAIFAIGYGSFRFFIEYFREPDQHLAGFMDGYITMGQLLSLPMVFAGVFVLLYVKVFTQPQMQTPHKINKTKESGRKAKKAENV